MFKQLDQLFKLSEVHPACRENKDRLSNQSKSHHMFLTPLNKVGTFYKPPDKAVALVVIGESHYSPYSPSIPATSLEGWVLHCLLQ